MKRILTILLACVMLAGGAMGVCSCGRKKAPRLDEVYDRLVQVIEASHEVNVLLFGMGLPVYDRGDAEDELVHRYFGFGDESRVYVTPYAKYKSVADMKAASLARIMELPGIGKKKAEAIFESLKKM